MTTTAAGPGDPRVDSGAPAAPVSTRWWVLAVICLAQFVVLLDNTVLNVAISSLARELHASTAQTQWMINADGLVQSGLLLTAGTGLGVAVLGAVMNTRFVGLLPADLADAAAVLAGGLLAAALLLRADRRDTHRQSGS
jgi:cytochrome c-type biogenesis protein CcmE